MINKIVFKPTIKLKGGGGTRRKITHCFFVCLFLMTSEPHRSYQAEKKVRGKQKGIKEKEGERKKESEWSLSEWQWGLFWRAKKKNPHAYEVSEQKQYTAV